MRNNLTAHSEAFRKFFEFECRYALLYGVLLTVCGKFHAFMKKCTILPILGAMPLYYLRLIFNTSLMHISCSCPKKCVYMQMHSTHATHNMHLTCGWAGLYVRRWIGNGNDC